LKTTSSCRRLAQLPDQTRQIQLESLLVKAAIISLALIMFNRSLDGGVKSLRWLNISER